MIYITLILACIAIALAFLTWRRGNQLNVELVKARSTILDLSRGVREIRGELQQTRQQISLMARQGNNAFTFEGTTLVRDALVMHPGVKEIFTHIHMDSDATIAINGDDTLEKVAIGHDRKPDHLVAALNSLFDQDLTDPPPTQPDSTGLIQIEPL
jgi:hypothetical protein